jgi:hypothetical protein
LNFPSTSRSTAVAMSGVCNLRSESNDCMRTGILPLHRLDWHPYALESLKILRPNFELVSHLTIVSVLLVLPLIESLHRNDQIG